MANPCVSQADCHSATTASVSSLAAGFRFHLYSVHPLPRNFNIGCCANEKLLRFDRTPARSIFHVYVCINIGLGGRGGAR